MRCHSYLLRKKKFRVLFLDHNHSVSLCFLPPTRSAVPQFALCCCDVHLRYASRAFMWCRKLPDSKLTPPCNFDCFMKYVVLARVKTMQHTEKRTIGTGSEQINSLGTDSPSIFVKYVPYFYLGYKLNPVARHTCSPGRKATILALLASFCHSYCVGKKKQTNIVTF